MYISESVSKERIQCLNSQNCCFEMTSYINHGHHGEPKVWEKDRVVLTYSSLMGEVVDETGKGGI